MAASPQQLIAELLSQPRIQSLHASLADHCASALTEQGLEAQGPAHESLIDTGVGRMRRLSVELFEPLSGGLMELQVFLLAKVDGSVHCWSELWGTPQGEEAEAGVGRVAQLGGGVQVTLPRRLRLARKNHFEGHVGKAWARQPDALQLAERRLAEQGLFSAAAGSPQCAAELARAVTA